MAWKCPECLISALHTMLAWHSSSMSNSDVLHCPWLDLRHADTTLEMT